MNEERLNKLNKLAFTELRVVGFVKGYERVFSRRLVMAMTANEELKNLGYTLTPSGVRMLANSNNVINTKEFINNIRVDTIFDNCIHSFCDVLNPNISPSL